MRKSIATLAFVVFLSGCDAITGAYETVKEGVVQAQGVSEDIEKAAGARPGVSIKWKNGELAQVILNFESVPKDVRVADLVEHARASVRKRLTNDPKQLLISFSIAAR